MRIPWITAALVATAALVSSLGPSLGETLQYTRGGPWWSAVSGQLVHWTARMAWIDLGLLAVAGIWLERRSRLLQATSLLLAVPAVTLAIHASSGMQVYRGSSGLTVALLACLLTDLVARGGRAALRGAAALGLLLIAVKIAWEWATGSALAAGPLPVGVRVAPQVHLLGALAGVAAFAASQAALSASAKRASTRPRALP